MKSQEWINKTEDYVLHTYNRFPVVFERGSGCRLYDADGKEYLDFSAGIAVNALGYGNEKYTAALKDQIDQLTHISNLFYNEPLAEAAEKLVKASGLSKAFFTNSGTEAIEGAIKAARKYAWTKNGSSGGRSDLIAMEHSFHGRSLGALSVTGTKSYRDPFEPLVPGVKFAKFNDIDSVKELVDEKTCAIILEAVQGEGGIIPAEEAFLREVRRICDENDIVLIMDEIQCGMGRTGFWFAWQKYGVKPDIMTAAKALGGGVPVGAFVLNEKLAQSSLVPGDHGTTYGGNPFVCAAVKAVFDVFEEEDLVGHVKETALYLEQKLDELVSEYVFLSGRRGIGFMQGLVFDGVKASDAASAALKEGLVVITAGGNVLRLVPPLVIRKDEIDEMCAKLSKALETCCKIG